MALLLTNDDGINAPGLAALSEALGEMDRIVISAPAENRSGVGGGIAMNRTLTAVRHADSSGGFPRHSLDGTSADAVKYGLRYLMAENAPRLVVSGINNGPNVGFSIRNSGALGAAFTFLKIWSWFPRKKTRG